MHTRNTTQKQKRESVSLGKAISVLELLTHQDTQLVLNYFCQYRQASYLDLLVFSQLDADYLGHLLEALCQARIIRESDSVYGTEYELNFRRIKLISSLTRGLADGVRVPEPVLA